MSTKAEHYDVIRKPIITEKATRASEANAVVFEVAIDSNKPMHQSGCRKLSLTCKGEGREHSDHQRESQSAFRGALGKRRKDVKKAYVTLEEGNTIDVTTGL